MENNSSEISKLPKDYILLENFEILMEFTDGQFF